MSDTPRLTTKVLLFLTLWLAGAACTAPAPAPIPDADLDGGGPPLPIHVLFNVHGHNYSGDDGPLASASDKLPIYERHKEQILFVRDTAEANGLKVSFQLNGEYARDARLLDADAPATLAELSAAGHSIGTHTHPFAFTGPNEYWTPYPPSVADPTSADLIVSSHVDELVATLGHPIRHLDAALNWLATPEMSAKYGELMDRYALDIEPAGEAFSCTRWGHFPWTPFRRRAGTASSADPAGPWIAIPTHSQTGLEIPQGAHALSNLLPQLKRHFVALFAQREYARRQGTDRVWTIGFMTHPSEQLLHPSFRADVAELMAWLATWAARPADGPVVAFVNDEAVADAFVAWEAEHPGVSSFDFDQEAYDRGEEPAYPYDLPGMVLGVRDTDLVGELEDWADRGVVAFQLAHRTIERRDSGRACGEIASVGPPETPLYLLWSASGDATTVDLSARHAGTLHVKDGVTAEVREVDAASVPVGDVPVVVSPDASILAP
ncbi:MAG: hypothetical protein IT383_29300 [Deltaproteobacteria bacterium]|nr:hypothetical protein [Deltaproteobacteria bacterium]